MVSEFPDQVSGFIVVPIVLSPHSSKSPVYHTLYLKKHEVRLNRKSTAAAADSDDDDADQADRTVFVVNLPAITTFGHIKSLCQDIAGVIAEDFVFDVGNTGKIVLVDKTSALRLVSKAKQLYKLEQQVSWTSKNLTTSSYGLKSKFFFFFFLLLSLIPF